MRHPDDRKILVKYHNILQAWEYLTDDIELSDILEKLTDSEIVDEYISRFGQVIPSEVDCGE